MGRHTVATKTAGKMAMSAKERMTLWRQRLKENPEMYERHKEKERERYRNKKDRGIVKSVSEQSSREARKTRRNWKRNSRRYRKRQKEVQNLVTPPDSPEEDLSFEIPGPPNRARSSSMKSVLAKKRKRKKAKAYRTIQKLEVKLKFEKRRTDRYRKRYQRLRVKMSVKKPTKSKAYVLYKTIVDNIRQRYRKSKSYEERQKIAGLVTNPRILRKYQITGFARKQLGLSRRHVGERARRPINLKSLRLRTKIIEFFERDDNSRLKAGKQATITRKGVKKQIRILTDDIKTLHRKYLSENNKNSYSLFARLRPFWVVKPTEKERDTCLCKLHDNLQLKVNAGYYADMYETKDINTLVKHIVCSDEDQQCMYRECQTCKDKTLAYNDNGDEGKQVTWKVWRTKRFERQDSTQEGSQVKVVIRTIKETDQGSKPVLSDEINKEIARACRHIFNIRNQYQSLHLLRNKLTQEEIVLHCDFSENYLCKYSSEIQSMHFGASKRQVTLHTGVAYIGTEIMPFCSVSDSLKHNPAAIWAHLDPVIKYITSSRKVCAIHFISDGPTTQYRNKQNFYLWNKMTVAYGIKRSTWNFLEAGHGKGAADGVGAAVKRNADSQVVVKGKDITCAEDFLSCVTDSYSKIKFFKVDDQAIADIEARMPSTLRPIPNTMKIHQLVFDSDGVLFTRYLSCFCDYPAKLLCNHFQPKKCIIYEEDVSSAEESTQPVEAIDRNQRQGASCESMSGGVTKLLKVDDLNEEFVSKYCVVSYDSQPYPGIIISVDDEEAEVKVMHSIGKNRFFWPRMDDILWYKTRDIVTILEQAPQPVTSRHMKIQDDIWNLVEKELDL